MSDLALNRMIFHHVVAKPKICRFWSRNSQTWASNEPQSHDPPPTAVSAVDDWWCDCTDDPPGGVTHTHTHTHTHEYQSSHFPSGSIILHFDWVL